MFDLKTTTYFSGVAKSRDPRYALNYWHYPYFSVLKNDIMTFIDLILLNFTVCACNVIECSCNTLF